MFNLKSSDPLERLLSGAQDIVDERAKILEAIQNGESCLSDAEQEERTAQERVVTEEYEAAQVEGGLAVASKRAQQAVTDAELKVKSVRLRLQGLVSKLASVEQKLLPAWAELERYRDDFITRQFSDLRDQFDVAIEAIVRLLFKAYALQRHPAGKFGEKCDYGGLGLQRMRLWNPIKPNGAKIVGGIFEMGDRTIGVNDYWPNDSDAGQLDHDISAIKDRIAPIGTVVGEIEGSGTE